MSEVKISKKEIKKLAEEEAEKILKNMNKEFEILVQKEEGFDVKLPYKESYNEHWKNKLKEQFEFFAGLRGNIK